MKNLKKVLSLALAFAMVLGLCIGAMAADTKTQNVTTLKDWADVTNKDAAQLLNAFNIMQGDSNGNFRPADPVTRAEATKMISVALWGGDDLKDLFKDGTTTFTDINSTDWFAGYVKYAATSELVAGRNATTFDPQGNVTGYELLKMTLTALGYRQEDEGLVGAGWQTKTMILATGNDLTEGVDIANWNLPINREDTAQVIANMITATTVKYDRDGYVIESTATAPIPTFGEMYLKLEKVEGILVANAYATMPKDQYYNAATGTAAPTGNYEVSDPAHFNSVLLPIVDNKYGNAIDVNTTSGLYDLGSKAVAYKKGDTVISVAITPAAVVTNPYAGTDTGAKALTIGTESGAKYTSAVKLDTNANGKTDLTITVHYSTLSDVKAVVESETWGTVYQTGSVAWRDAYEDAATLPNSFKAIKFVTGATAAKDDKVVTVESTLISSTTPATKVVIGAALETVEGTNTRINAPKYYIDGTEYTDKTGSNVDLSGFGVSGVFYTYPGTTEIVTATISGGAQTSVALLYDAGLTPGGGSTAIGGTATKPVVTVAAILSDGTKGTYTATKFGTTDLNSNDGIINVFGSGNSLNGLNTNSWVTVGITGATGGDNNYLVNYYLDENGNMIITELCTTGGTIGSTTAATNITTSTTSVLVGGASKLITPETVTFIQTSVNGTNTSEDWTAYVGRTVNYSIAQNNTATVVLGDYNGIKDTAVKYAVVKSNSLVPDSGKSNDFYYIIAAHGQVSPLYDEYVVFDASANEVKTVNVATGASNKPAEGKFYTTFANNNFSDEITFAGAPKGYVSSFANNIIVISSFAKTSTGDEYALENKAYVVNDETKYFVIGDEETSEKITAADVAIQGPTSEPKSETTIPYQAIVEVDKGVVTTVILFAEEQVPAAE